MYQNAFENGLIACERYLSIDELQTVVQWSNDLQAHIQPPNEAQIQPNGPNEAVVGLINGQWQMVRS